MKTVKIGIDEVVRISNPYEILTYTDEVFISSMFQGLVTYSNKGVLIPALCSRYCISNDGTHLTFEIKNKRWSNGDFITAFDFKRMFLFLIKNHKKYACAELLFSIKNVVEYIENKVNIENIGVNARKYNCLEILLEYKNYDFINVLARPMFSPIHKKMNVEYCYNITNGPYFMKEYNTSDKTIKLRRNTFFDIKSDVEILEFDVIDNYEIQNSLYKNNELHISCNTLFDHKLNFKDEDEKYVVKLPLKYFLFISQEKMKIFNSEIRREIFNRIYKINFHEKANGISNAASFLPEFIFNMKKESCNNFNIDLKVKNVEHYSILYADYYPNKIIAETIQTILKDIGYETFLKKMNHKDIYNQINLNNYDLAIGIVSIPYLSPSAMLNMFIDEPSLEDQIDNYNMLIEDYYSDVYDRKNVINNLLKILDYKLPIIPICEMEGIYFKKNWVSGFKYKVDGLPTFDNLSIKK